MDSDLIVVDGGILTKNELKSRLNEMQVNFNTNVIKKDYYAKLYNDAVRLARNRNKIKERLRKDTELCNRKKRAREESEVEIGTGGGRRGKVEKSRSGSRTKKEKKGDTEEICVKKEEEIRIVCELIEKENLRTMPENEAGNQTEHVHHLHDDHIHKMHNIVDFDNFNSGNVNPLIFTTHNMNNMNNITETPKEFKNDEENLPIFNNYIDKLQINKNPNYPSDFSSNFTKFSSPKISEFNNDQPILITPTPKKVDTDSPIVFSFPEQIRKNLNLTHEHIANQILKKDEKETKTQIIPIQYISTTTSLPYVPPHHHHHHISSTPPKESIDVNLKQPQSNKNAQIEENIILEREPEIESVSLSRNNEVFNDELERVKKLSINKNKKSINGAGFQEAQKITVSTIQTINLNKGNGYEKWELPYEKDKVYSQTFTPSIKLLVKYFLAGMACSVIFYGLLYCVQNCPAINFENLEIKKITPKTQPVTVKEVLNIPDNVKDTISSRTYNLGLDALNQEEVGVSMGHDIHVTFRDRLKDFFSPLSKIYWALTNPREFLYNIFIDGLGGYLSGGLHVTINFLRNNMWTVLGLILLKYILYRGIKLYMDNQKAISIYNSVKERLRMINDINCRVTAIAEEEIIRDYSRDYNIEEMQFRETMMPRIRELKNKDREIREFVANLNGKDSMAWQYCGELNL